MLKPVVRMYLCSTVVTHGEAAPGLAAPGANKCRFPQQHSRTPELGIPSASIGITKSIQQPFDKVCPLLGATIHRDRTIGAIDALECLAYGFYM